MAGRSSRNKGAAGEREFIGLLAPVVTRACLAAGAKGIGLSRNFAQASCGGSDMDSLEHLGFIFEVKRHETLAINTWWAQVTKAVRGRNCWPILAYRQNRQPWTFVVDCRMLWIEAEGRIYMEQDVFLSFFEKSLTSVLTRQNEALIVRSAAAETCDAFESKPNQ